MTDQLVQTTQATFEELYASQYRVIPVVRTVDMPSVSPVDLYATLTQSAPGTFLLESAEQGGIWSRFSFIGVSSFGVLTDRDGTAVWLSNGLTEERAFGGTLPHASLLALDQLYRRWQTPRVLDVPPLTGGLVGFLGWETVRQIERLPQQPPKDIDIPDEALSFVRDMVVIDHKYGQAALITNVLFDDSVDSSTAWVDGATRLNELSSRLEHPTVETSHFDMSVTAEPRLRTDPQDYIDSVVTSKDYIVDGDIFQVVISQRFDIDNSADPLDVYRVLRELNPSPYMYMLSLAKVDGSPYYVVGSSPEALVKVDKGRVYSHPIAGSRPRGADAAEDVRNENDLLADAKEKAEHLMLVDLARNDLLKVCDAGSVEVTEFMRIERFSHIMHIVSSVEGNLLPEKNSVDVFRATFPAGTLSGAPKPRALEIIDELEPAQRGVYGGVVGYFDFAGDADLAIAIRTATLVGGTAHVQAGGGLVADSVPQTEYIESQNKAAAPLRAVAIANAQQHQQ